MTDPARTTLSGLPVELRQAILSYVDNPHTLNAAATASKSLAEALQAPGCNNIAGKVFARAVPLPLVPEAVAVLQARRTKNLSLDGLVKLLRDYFSSLEGGRPQCCWSLKSAVALYTLHQTVQKLADEFVQEALSREPSTDERIEPSRITLPDEQELQRIHRAFYRFELYCNLHSYFSSQRQRGCQIEHFFAGFAPWETEQLASVYEFLYDRITEPFNDIAAHDVEWGEKRISHLDSLTSSQENRERGIKEHYLSRGLEFITKLGAATDFAERAQILKSEFGKTNSFLDRRSIELSWDLNLRSPTQSNAPFVEHRVRHEKHLGYSSSVSDPDSGPAHMWNWLHRRPGSRQLFSPHHNYYLRRRGYVFWNQTRIDTWLRLDVPCYPPTCPAFLTEEDEEKMRYSWARRNELYRRGGRGWWSESNESQVVYNESQVVYHT